MEPNNNPVDSQGEAPSTLRLVLAGCLGVGLVCILVILAIQIMEFSFYRTPPSVWPGAAGSGGSPVGAVVPPPTPSLPAVPPASIPPPAPAEVPAATVPAVANAPAAVTPAGPTPAPAEPPASAPTPVTASDGSAAAEPAK